MRVLRHPGALALVAVLCVPIGAAGQEQPVPPPPSGGGAASQEVPVVEHPSEAPAEEALPAPNSIYAEGLGAGLAYSVNYERLVVPELAVRVGLSYLSVSASATSSDGSTSTASSSFLTFPITASYIGLRSGKHALELGGGATVTYTSARSSALGVSASGSGVTALGTAMVGYRIHPVGGPGFQFRVGAMALIGKGLSLSTPDPETIGVLPWFYISMGASF